MSPRRIAKILAWSGAVALAAVVLVATWVVRHRADNEAMRRAVGVLPGALLHAHSFHWTQMKGDRKQWEVAAGEASYSDDKKRIRLSDAELSMIAEDGKQVTVTLVTADLVLLELQAEIHNTIPTTKKSANLRILLVSLPDIAGLYILRYQLGNVRLAVKAARMSRLLDDQAGCVNEDRSSTVPLLL